MVTSEQCLDLLEGLIVDVDAMGGIRVDSAGRPLGLAEEIDVTRWANLTIHLQAASELLVRSGYPELLTRVANPDLK